MSGSFMPDTEDPRLRDFTVVVHDAPEPRVQVQHHELPGLAGSGATLDEALDDWRKLVTDQARTMDFRARDLRTLLLMDTARSAGFKGEVSRRRFNTPRGIMEWDSSVAGVFYWVVHDGQVVAISCYVGDGKRYNMVDGYPWREPTRGGLEASWEAVELVLGRIPMPDTGAR